MPSISLQCTSKALLRGCRVPQNRGRIMAIRLQGWLMTLLFAAIRSAACRTQVCCFSRPWSGQLPGKIMRDPTWQRKGCAQQIQGWYCRVLPLTVSGHQGISKICPCQVCSQQGEMEAGAGCLDCTRISEMSGPWPKESEEIFRSCVGSTFPFELCMLSCQSRLVDSTLLGSTN